MLLAVVHANGSYFPHEGVNELPSEMPDGYHQSLARLVAMHVGNDQPVAYMPYWVDPHKTGVHYDAILQEAALVADPFYQALPPDTRTGVRVIPDGPDPSLDYQISIRRDHSLDGLARGQRTACFVGAYAGACVLDRAVQMHDRMNPSERPRIFIDPNHCVDIGSRPVHAWASGWMNLDPYSRHSE